MSIVGGLDIHRKQLTFDCLDTATGQVQRGQIAPADREHLRAWLARFADRGDVAFEAEGLHRVAVCQRGAGRGRDRRASGRADRYRFCPRPQAARQDRPDRRSAPAAAAG
jgi:transposase